jgi:N-methylhydantoinase A
VLIAYGGAGPVHASGLAEELGCTTVIVPALAGLFSSLGLLFARPEFHDVFSCQLDARTVEPAALAAVFAQLEARVAPSLQGQAIEWVRSAELRYGGQTWEIEVELPPGPLEPPTVRALLARFEDEHERLYGVRGEAGAPIEIRALRLGGLGPSSAVDRLVPAGGDRDPGGQRAAFLAGRFEQLPVRSRASVGEQPEPGPLLVDEYDTTVLVRPGWTIRRDPATAALLLERAGGS